jgi:hypothetical protein
VDVGHRERLRQRLLPRGAGGIAAGRALSRPARRAGAPARRGATWGSAWRVSSS